MNNLLDQLSDLPNDTLLDELIHQTPGMSQGAADFMKAAYLSFEALQDCARANHWSKTEAINTAEELRRAGLIKLYVDKQNETIRIVPLWEPGKPPKRLLSRPAPHQNHPR